MRRICLCVVIVLMFILTGCFQLQKNSPKTGQIKISLNIPGSNESGYPKWSWPPEKIQGINSQKTKNLREIIPGTDLIHILIYNKLTQWKEEITIEIDPSNVPTTVTRTIEVPAGSGYKIEVFPWATDFWASVTAGEAENITITPNETTPVVIELKRTEITDLTIPASVEWGEKFTVTAMIKTPVDIEGGTVVTYFTNNPDVNQATSRIVLYGEDGLVFVNGVPRAITVNKDVDYYSDSTNPVEGTYYLVAIGILYEDHPIMHSRYDLIWLPEQPIPIDVSVGMGSLEIIIQ